MEERFPYRFDRPARRLSWIISLTLLAIFASFVLLMPAGYLRAWSIAILLAVVLLYVLSIPRYIKLTDDMLEIHCVVEMTRIPVEDIDSVRRIEKRDLGRLVLLLGSYGFFGYYGYYANLSHWQTIKVYATQWNNLIEVEDIYEERFLVSCHEADRLIEAIAQAKLARAGDSRGRHGEC